MNTTETIGQKWLINEFVLSFFLFHLKPKTNLVTSRKFNSHLQYYKIDLSFSIKLQETNLSVRQFLLQAQYCADMVASQ